ncbi:MAG: signal transduction histidine kinase, LytS [Paenibacillaceae bacterium]|jgi:signal transduction histidine kinase|nr:signal transduction histidine kinase, LytS [Paenibacillaceae bacterium]
MKAAGKWIGITSLTAALILLVTLLYTGLVEHGSAPPAQKGVMDLRGLGLPERGMAQLSGEWEFVPDKLLEPGDPVFEQPGEAIYLETPWTWRGKHENGGVHAKGSGTYRLKVLVPADEAIYGIKITNIRMAHKLYINGHLEGGSGTPAYTREEHSPGNTPYTVFFQSDNDEIEIVIQVSNHVFFNGGIARPIQLGAQRDVMIQTALSLGGDLACVLIFTLVGIHQLLQYLPRREDRSYLYCGLFLVLIAIGQTMQDEKIAQRLLPQIPFDVIYKALDITIILSALVAVLLFSSLNSRMMSKRAQIILILPLVLCVGVIPFIPYHVFNDFKLYVMFYLAIVEFSMVLGMVRLYSRRQKGSYESKELLLFIAAVVCLLVYLVADSLAKESMMSSDFIGKMGAVLFTILMNILLAFRFARTMEETKSLTRQLTASNQAKDEFLIMTSHEIRTPLNAIMNITSHLMDDGEGALSAKQQQDLRLVKDTSVKLTMLMQDLIDVTRLRHGEMNMQITSVNVRSVAKLVLDILQFELAGKNVALLNEIPAALWVHADENRLRQVLYNLVHNAIKHTEAGSITLNSTVAGSAALITVEDTGAGITPEKQQRLLNKEDPFGYDSPAEGYTGMGVGLYICRKLAEGMNGSMDIEWSEPGRGTRMKISLPLEEAAVSVEDGGGAESPRRHSLQILEPLDIVGEHKQTILIVDDEPSNIYTLLNILRRHPYNLLSALSAKEALAQIARHPNIDLIILDVMMPDVSGIELCRMLREQHSILSLPILFATAKDRSQDVALGFAAGANDYVTKPFEGETMLARIQTLLAMKSAFQEAVRNELAFHQAQIKPHFLYNALSSVISFCYTDGEKAAYLLSRLSQYLRYILDMDRHELLVPLCRELELIEAYVEIERARFDDRFEFVSHVEKGLEEFPVPSLCIQPFVENAIRHGFFDQDGRGTVILTVDKVAEGVRVTIEDDGTGIPEDVLTRIAGPGKPGDGIGIGILNIRRRLESIPGAALQVASEPGRGTRIELRLPRDEEI